MEKRFLPRLWVDNIYEIPLEELYNKGFKGIITDLDNTLIGTKEHVATPELIAWLEKAKQIGYRIVILSNNLEKRVSDFSTPLGIPFFYRAKKPRKKMFHLTIKKIGLRPEETLMIGDQMMTDVLGGNRVGLHTILVKPITPHGEGFGTKCNRFMERQITKYLRYRGLLK